MLAILNNVMEVVGCDAVSGGILELNGVISLDMNSVGCLLRDHSIVVSHIKQ